MDASYCHSGLVGQRGSLDALCWRLWIFMSGLPRRSSSAAFRRRSVPASSAARWWASSVRRSAGAGAGVSHWGSW